MSSSLVSVLVFIATSSSVYFMSDREQNVFGSVEGVFFKGQFGSLKTEVYCCCSMSAIVLGLV